MLSAPRAVPVRGVSHPAAPPADRRWSRDARESTPRPLTPRGAPRSASAKLAGSTGAVSNTSVCITRAPAAESTVPATMPATHWSEPLSKHQTQDIAAPGAEGHANAHLTRALDHEVSHDGVDPYGGERQRQQREAGDQHHVETRPRQRAADHRVHRPDARHEQLRVERTEPRRMVGAMASMPGRTRAATARRKPGISPQGR